MTTDTNAETAGKLLPRLPVERALKVLAGRWKAFILVHLHEAGSLRYTALRERLDGISDRVLVRQLAELHGHGLIERRADPGAARRVDYRITPLGSALVPLIFGLCDWGRRHAAEQEVAGRERRCSDAYGER